VPLLSVVAGNGGLQRGEIADSTSGVVRFSGMAGRVVSPEGNKDGYCVRPLTPHILKLSRRE
jgi:hypothetical protein